MVYAKPTVKRPDAVLSYLGRYVQRVAISNSNILSMDDAQVTFRYHRVGDSQSRTMTLSAPEFIRRFLQHVLPDGFHKVRYYGLWAPAHRQALQRLQEELRHQEESAGCNGEQTESLPTDGHDHPQTPAHDQSLRCPKCHEGHLHWVARIPPASRDPPHD